MRKALVIGSQTGTLSGVHNDVEAMTALLSQRGFEIDSRTGTDATREGILDGYRNLIAGVKEGDAAVVYFSGHGGLARVVAPSGNPQPELQFIVPTDYDDSSPGDFRGITSVELSVLLAQLTQRTHNATVILDCCHSAHMSRDPGLRVRALPHPTYLDVAEHIGLMRGLGLRTDLVDPIGNPHAIRLVACAQWESAYEYTNNHRIVTGVVTDSLRVAFEELGTATVSWSTLVQRIRSRVSQLTTGQRPDVEGPAQRLLFDLDRAPTGRSFPVVRLLPGTVSLPGAALLGVGVGDEFSITPADAAQADETTTLARAKVSRTDGVTVEATVELCGGQRDLPEAVVAHPLSTSATRNSVRIQGSGPLADQVRAAIAAEPTLRPVAAADPADDEPVIAEVRVGDDVSLWDGGTLPLATATGDSAGIGRIVTDLVRLARTSGLRRLEPDPQEALTDTFGVEWGRVVAGTAQPLPPTGALLHAGDRVYLKLRNDSGRDLYFFVFDIGVAGAVRLVTTADWGGLRLAAGQEYVVGEGDNGLEGSELYWPPGVPTVDARTETVVVIVTQTPQDLAVLAHDGVDTAARGSSPLRQALAAAVRGGTRDWAATDTSRVRYGVVRLECQLSAVPAPVPETARFLVDERPDPSVRLLQPRGLAVAPPRKVAVRLNELVVHRNRALRGADVRVDALVLTGGDGELPVYRARTARFSNVHDGDRLPLDNLLVYHGPAVDYLDLAWWVSRDRRDSLTLNDMLRECLTSEELHRTVESAAALALAAPQAALAATAVGACAVIVSTAYRMLTVAVGNSVGLYRTSLLAAEGFGIGRHPASGMRRAQDFSFAYQILDASPDGT